MSSVEILDEGAHEWREGPELPFGIDQAQLVEDREVIEVFKRNGCRLTGLLWDLDKLMHKLTDNNTNAAALKIFCIATLSKFFQNFGDPEMIQTSTNQR